MLRACVIAADFWHGGGTPLCHTHTTKATAVPAASESKHRRGTEANKSLFYQTPELASLPCPLLGTRWI